MAKHNRGKGEGGLIYQECKNLWRASCYTGYKPDGSRIIRYVYDRTQEGCLRKKKDIEAQLHQGLYVSPDKMLLQEWMLTWFEQYVLPVRKRTTADTTHDIIFNHVIPIIGTVRLQQLRTEHVQAFVNTIKDNGKRGKSLAPATVKRIFTVLNSAMRQATDNNLIIRNPCTGVKLPKMQQKEIQVLEDWEQPLLLAQLPDSCSGRALLLAYNTGMRVSELCGLRWSDISGKFLTINQVCLSAHEYNGTEKLEGHLMFNSPKTEKSHRCIPLTNEMQQMLAAQRRDQAQIRINAGDGWQDNNLVFTTRLGTPLEKRNLLRTYQGALKQAGLNPRGLHTLRHTFATRAIGIGMDVRSLSELLGHEDVATTLNLYVHSNMDKKAEYMEQLAKLG